MEPIETIERAGLTIQVFQDQSAMSPRDAENLGILSFHHATGLVSEGDVPFYGANGLTEECSRCEGAGEYPGQAICERCEGSGEVPMAVKDYYVKNHGVVEALPVRYSDYGSSGDAIDVCDPEDANGIMYTTQEIVDKLGVPADDIKSQLEAELDEFNTYLHGEVWGYVIAGPNGEDLGTFTDSCWGFIASYGSGDSWKYFTDEANSAADGVREALDKAKIEPNEVLLIDAAKRFAKAEGTEDWKLESLLANRADPEAMRFSEIDVLRAILQGKVTPV